MEVGPLERWIAEAIRPLMLLKSVPCCCHFEVTCPGLDNVCASVNRFVPSVTGQMTECGQCNKCSVPRIGHKQAIFSGSR
jgi:hypothetical protein